MVTRLIGDHCVHVLATNKKEYWGQGVMHIVPSITQILPDSDPVSRTLSRCVFLVNLFKSLVFVILCFSTDFRAEIVPISAECCIVSFVSLSRDWVWKFPFWGALLLFFVQFQSIREAEFCLFFVQFQSVWSSPKSFCCFCVQFQSV